ncbi:transcriptional regulator [Candidatus Magnetobacterium casense]|uniref:transcriptional regulator n=1 Tax=Candidatus Magnetobacterium casense TaxID=1455061 RepID=UPI00058C48A9|nr:YdaS family helix-turn-helix protein [Candidatus Magnetobacterium casensis]
MSIREYIQQKGLTLTEAANRLRISQPYLSQIVNGNRGISRYVALAIEKETAGQIQASDLRPDIFKKLAKAKSFSLPPEAS